MPPALSAISPDQMCTRSSLKPMFVILAEAVVVKKGPAWIICHPRPTGNQLEPKHQDFRLIRGSVHSTQERRGMLSFGQPARRRRKLAWVAAVCYCDLAACPGQ